MMVHTPMAIPQDVVDRIEGLAVPLTAVHQAVEDILRAQQSDSDPMTRAEAVSSLETQLQSYLATALEVESVLLQYVPNGDHDAADQQGTEAADAVEQLARLSFIHLAVASDLAKLASIDALGEADPVRQAEPVLASDRASSIVAVVGGEAADGQPLGPITLVAEDAGDADPTLPPGGLSAEDVLTRIVDRAAKGVSSVLVGVAPSPIVVFGAVEPALTAALGLAPDVVARAAGKALGSIAHLVRLVLHHVSTVIETVSHRHAEVVHALLETLRLDEDVDKLLLEPAVRRVMSTVLGEERIRQDVQHLRVQQKQEYLRQRAHGLHPNPVPNNAVALRRLLKHNKLTVGPVPIVSHGLHPLWAVSLAGVPAAPIAGCLLLAWTILITGDQLDSPGKLFPNFWKPGLGSLF
jgi:hypothetical protein